MATAEPAVDAQLPQKRFYRQRAHTNPLADHSFSYPARPADANWPALFPGRPETAVTFLDVGCGYGGLLVALATRYPDKLSLGLEIRVKVSDYVQDRIKALRAKHPGQFNNVAVLRTNAMKYLPNYFEKGQLQKMFFLFPDPHFKKTKHKWRIINQSILAEYAFVLAEGGVVYTATDVQELDQWIVDHFTNFPLFQLVKRRKEEGEERKEEEREEEGKEEQEGREKEKREERNEEGKEDGEEGERKEEGEKEEEDEDPILALLSSCTEEGQKVSRAGGRVYIACFRRTADPFTGTRSPLTP